MCKYFPPIGQTHNQEVFDQIEPPPVSDDGDLADPQDPTDPQVFLCEESPYSPQRCQEE